ncbi:hypothetical protein MPRS_13230 [Mycobacterium paraseoulense]|nr:hypothetical protein MPRS_13230 [Mycobacterium paraseoulense]
MALQVGGVSVRLVEAPPDIEDGHRVAGLDEIGQLRHAGQHLVSGCHRFASLMVCREPSGRPKSGTLSKAVA